MSAPALRLHGRLPRWSGWALTAAVHVAMLLALVSAFAPKAKPPVSMAISARLLPSSSTPAATPAAVPIALPRALLNAPPVPDIPPPPVQITAAPPVAVATTPLRFDAPAAAPADTSATPATAAPHPTAVAAVSAVAPTAPPPVPTPSPALTESPVALPADHRLCSDRETARHYPAMLRDRGIQGRVVLRVKVDAQGRAAEVIVSGASGWRLLDEAARRVAESCPFVPARRGDQRLVSWVEYPVRFALQPSSVQ